MVVAVRASVDDVVGERRGAAEGFEVEVARVAELVFERRRQVLAGHYARRRDVDYLLWISKDTGCEGEAEIIWMPTWSARLLELSRLHTKAPVYVCFSRVFVDVGAAQFTLNTLHEVGPLGRG
jgi:hypothetical protein